MYEQPHNPIDAPDNAVMTPDPTSAGVAAPVPDAPAGAKAAKVSKSTLAMAGLFVAGMAILIALAGGTSPQQASASDKAITQQVDTFLTHSQTKSHDPAGNEGARMVASFYHYASRRQIPVDQLQTNPFARGGAPCPAAAAQPGAAPQPKVVTVANAQKRKELKQEFDKLKLQGVMTTPRGGTAIINSTFVMKGFRLGRFIVTAVRTDSVDLTCDQMVFTLRLDR